MAGVCAAAIGGAGSSSVRSAGSATSARLTVRYDRLLATYGGFFHLARALLVLRRVLK
jgi:hypothetical protein